MNLILALILSLGFAVSGFAQTTPEPPLDLTGIVGADVKSANHGPNVHLDITLNLPGNVKWTMPGGFYLAAADIEPFKNGTNPQKAAIRKKYTRMAIRNYRQLTAPIPAPVVQGLVTVAKGVIAEPGDTQ